MAIDLAQMQEIAKENASLKAKLFELQKQLQQAQRALEDAIKENGKLKKDISDLEHEKLLRQDLQNKVKTLEHEIEQLQESLKN